VPPVSSPAGAKAEPAVTGTKPQAGQSRSATAGGLPAAASDYGPYCLQLGSFRHLQAAQKLAGELAAANLQAAIVEAEVNGELFHRVWVPHLESREDAARLGERLKAELGISYLVRTP
jgi:cell division septation protein DedD